jgi:transcriptional regulator with XRE-family HTH domain
MTINDRRAMGERLKAAREAMKLTQAQAAKRLGLTVTTTLSNYEQGRTEVPIRMLGTICHLYRMKLTTLVLGNEQEELVDLEERRRRVKIEELTRELIGELVKVARALDELYSNNNNDTVVVRRRRA